MEGFMVKLTENELALLRFIASAPKVSGSAEHPTIKVLLDHGLIESAPLDKGGLIGPGFQVTARGRVYAS
jgi:hypothetical protein